MFGSLLGTLAKFRQEESTQKDKVLITLLLTSCILCIEFEIANFKSLIQ